MSDVAVRRVIDSSRRSLCLLDSTQYLGGSHALDAPRSRETTYVSAVASKVLLNVGAVLRARIQHRPKVTERTAIGIRDAAGKRGVLLDHLVDNKPRNKRRRSRRKGGVPESGVSGIERLGYVRSDLVVDPRQMRSCEVECGQPFQGVISGPATTARWRRESCRDTPFALGVASSVLGHASCTSTDPQPLQS